MGFNNATLDAYDDELEHVYLCEGAAGSDLIDLLGSLDLTQTNSPPSVTGENNNARDCNNTGSDKYFGVGTAALTQTSDYAVSFWANLNATTNGYLFAQMDSINNKDAPTVALVSSKFQLYVSTTGTDIDITTVSSYTTGKWYHIGFYVDVSAKTGYLYIDGFAETSSTGTGTLRTPDNTYVGARNFTGTPESPSDARFDELYIWEGLDLTGGTDMDDFFTALQTNFYKVPIIAELIGRYDTSSITAELIGRYKTNEFAELVGRYGTSSIFSELIGRYRTSIKTELIGRYDTSAISAELIGRYRTSIQAELIGRYASVGEKRFDLYLYKDGILEDTETYLFSGGTSIDDAFPSTTLVQASYRIEAEANEFLPNKQKNSFTVLSFSIDAGGLLIPQVPNAPNFLTAEARAGGKALLRWRYDTFNQEVAPTVFNIYHNSGGGGVDYGTIQATVNYTNGVFKYNKVLTGLTDNLTYIFGVRSADDLDEEQNTNTASALIDGTAPPSQPFNFGFS